MKLSKYTLPDFFKSRTLSLTESQANLPASHGGVRSLELIRVLWIISLYLALGSFVLLMGCSDSAPNGGADGKTQVQVLRYQGHTGAVFFPELAEDLGYLAPIKLQYVGNVLGGPPDIQTVVTHDVDFGTAFTGAIIKLRAAGLAIKSVITSYGTDNATFFGHFVTEDSPIKTARDLIGKKIAVNTLGAHSDFIIREYLARNGLTPQEIEKVELVVIPPVNAEQALRNHQVDAVALNGVLKDLALQRGGLRLLFTDLELFGPFNAGSYVFTEDFIAQNPDTVAKFVEATAKAIEWARNTPKEDVIARYKKIIASRGRNENDQAINFWKSPGIATKGGLILPSDFQVWLDWLVKNGQLKPGQLALTDLYDNRFNPYTKDATLADTQTLTEQKPL